MNRLAATLLATSVFAAASAHADSASGFAYYGAVGLKDASTASYLVSRSAGFEWATLGDPFTHREVVATYPASAVPADSGYSNSAPVTRLSPDGTRQILFLPASTYSGSNFLFDLDANGATAIAAVDASVTGFAATFGANGTPSILLSAGGSLRLLEGTATAGGTFTTLAAGPDAGCASAALALVPDETGFLGLCGDRPLRLDTAGGIAVGDPLIAPAFASQAIVASAGVRGAAGSPVFFVVTEVVENGWPAGSALSIHRIQREASVWTSQYVADVPLISINDALSISVANENALAIVGETADYTSALYLVRADGASWVTEPVGTVDGADRVAAAPSGNRLFTGSLRLRVHTFENGAWTTRDLGKIGQQDVFYGCSIGALETLPAAGPVLLGFAALLGASLVRRRR